MRKFFFALLFSFCILLGIVFWIISAVPELQESDSIDLWEQALPPPFSPESYSWGQGPIKSISFSKEIHRSQADRADGCILIIGFEGLTWDVLNHLIRSEAAPNLKALVARGLRAALKTGLSDYATPEAAWLRVLTGKPNPSAKDPFVWDVLKQERLALLDLPYADPADTSEELFFSLARQGVSYANSLPVEKEIPSSLDFAGTKFRILRDRDFDLAIVSINQPDKTQHRALLGYVVERMMDKTRFFIHEPFGPIFEKNRIEMEGIYNDLDRLAEYLLRTYPNDFLVLFSVHGHQLVPYEVRVQYEPALWKKIQLHGATNSTEPQDIQMTVGDRNLPGRQRAKAHLLPAITDRESGRTTQLSLSYFQWEFEAGSGSLNIASRLLLARQVQRHLSVVQYDGKPFFTVGYRDDRLVAEPSFSTLRALLSDPDQAFSYSGLISVTRVQSGHPADADGVFLASGPGLDSNRVIEALFLQDVLPAVLGNRFPGTRSSGTGSPFSLLREKN